MILTSPVLVPALITATAMLVGVRGSRQSEARTAPIHAARQDQVRQLLARRVALGRLVTTVERLRQEVFEVTLPRCVGALRDLEGADLDALCCSELPEIAGLQRRTIRRAGGLAPKSRAWVLGGPAPAMLLGTPLSRSLRSALQGRTVRLSEADEATLRRLQTRIDQRITALSADRDALQRQHRHSVRLLAEVRVALRLGRDVRRMSRLPLPGQATSTWQLIANHAHATQALIALSSSR